MYLQNLTYSFLKRNLLFAVFSVLMFSCSKSEDEGTQPVAAAPSALSYSPNSLTITQGNAETSAAPTITSSSAVSYAITSTPATAALTINSQGVIAASSSLPAGTYSISITATNTAGSKTFANAYTITVNAASTAVTFNNTVKAIIQNNCGSCHNGFTSYATAKTKIDVILNRINRAQGATGMMPNNGTKLPQATIDLIQKWKDDGLQE